MTHQLHEEVALLVEGKVTASSVRKVLAGEFFRRERNPPPHDMTRSAQVSRGISVRERRPAKMVKNKLAAGPAKLATFEVTVFQGDDAPRGRWKTEEFDKLSAAVAHVNANREAAERAYG